MSTADLSMSAEASSKEPKLSETAATVGSGSAHQVMVDPKRLHRFAHQVFEQLGMNSDDATMMADYFVWVELHDRPFLGVRRMPEFVERVRQGGSKLSSDSDSMIVHERAAFVLVDAGDTFAQLTGARAMAIAVDKARSAGVGVAVVRNVTTAGALGYYAMLAAEQQMIGMAINNTPPVMPGWGGATRVMGAQPFAVATPAGRHQPLLLDMTNSVMSMARMHEYHQRGEQLPSGAALTSDGAPTVDPLAAIKGVLLPMGHRGYGLALLWEVLTGVLAGGPRFAGDVGFPADHEEPMGVSLFLMAIDPTAAMPYETFIARTDEMIDRMHTSPPAPGADRVVVPGERSQNTAQARRERGIPLPTEVVASLEALGAEVGAPW